jgi:hypothetical protein
VSGISIVDRIFASDFANWVRSARLTFSFIRFSRPRTMHHQFFPGGVHDVLSPGFSGLGREIDFHHFSSQQVGRCMIPSNDRLMPVVGRL